jgi:transposase
VRAEIGRILLYTISSIDLNGHRESNALADSASFVTRSESPGTSSIEPTSEVAAPLKRRRRTAAFKLRIIAAADACELRGDLGALLRTEGVYHSDLANWRKQKAQGQLSKSPVSRAQRSDPKFQEAVKQQVEMSREIRDLRRQLGRAKMIIDIQKKAALLLGETLQEMSLDDFDE